MHRLLLQERRKSLPNVVAFAHSNLVSPKIKTIRTALTLPENCT
jgi:hypothetical protein